MLVHVCLFSYNLSLQQQIENRMVIKYFYLTILFGFSLSIAWGQNSEKLDFSSPEERILFNKKNGFEKSNQHREPVFEDLRQRIK